MIAVVDNAAGQATATPMHEVTMETAMAMVQAVAAAGTGVRTDGSRVYDPLTSPFLNRSRRGAAMILNRSQGWTWMNR